MINLIDMDGMSWSDFCRNATLYQRGKYVVSQINTTSKLPVTIFCSTVEHAYNDVIYCKLKTC